MVVAPAAKAPARVQAEPGRGPQPPVPVRIPAPRAPLEDVVCPLRHHLQAPGQARRAAHAALQAWGLDSETTDAAVLVACELLTNAIEHAQAPLHLHLHRGADQAVWIAVSDGGPATREGAWTRSCTPDEHGRGLAIVQALATRHGHRTHPHGAIHWARLSTL